MIRLLWVGITSNPIFGGLDAILKKYWGLLKQNTMKNVIILVILAPQVFVNTTQFQDSIVTVHQKGGGGVKNIVNHFPENILVITGLSVGLFQKTTNCCISIVSRL